MHTFKLINKKVFWGAVMKFLLYLCAAVFCVGANAADLTGRFSDAETIKKILSSIPMEDKDFGYKSLSERLPNLGLSVTQVQAYAVNKVDVAASGGMYKAGDIEYEFRMTAPHQGLLSICPLFLVRNRCDAPNF